MRLAAVKHPLGRVRFPSASEKVFVVNLAKMIAISIALILAGNHDSSALGVSAESSSSPMEKERGSGGLREATATNFVRKVFQALKRGDGKGGADGVVVDGKVASMIAGEEGWLDGKGGMATKKEQDGGGSAGMVVDEMMTMDAGTNVGDSKEKEKDVSDEEMMMARTDFETSLWIHAGEEEDETAEQHSSKTKNAAAVFDTTSSTHYHMQIDENNEAPEHNEGFMNTTPQEASITRGLSDNDSKGARRHLARLTDLAVVGVSSNVVTSPLANANFLDTNLDPANWSNHPKDNVVAPETAYIDVDLGKKMEIHAVTIWHYWFGSRSYKNQKLEVSRTGAFNGEQIEIYNVALGPVETSSGNTITLSSPVVGRYIRHTCGGSTANNGVHFIGLEVDGEEVNPTELKFIHWNPETNITACQGDCDNDSHCEGDLVCFHREDGDPVPPGCIGNPSGAVDYCYEAFQTSLSIQEVPVGTEASGELKNDLSAVLSKKATIIGSGSDIWGQQDSFFFAKRTITPNSFLYDNFDVEVFTENGFTNSNSYKWAKFGLMVRDTMDPKSRHFSVILTPKEGVHAIYRPDFGSDTSRIPGNNDVRGGGWMKLVRNRNLFRAYFKKEDEVDLDGKIVKAYPYVLLGEKSINMSGSVEVGLALASHASSSCLSETIQFSYFDIKASKAMWAAPIDTNSASGELSNDVNALDGGDATITGSGSDIWGQQDSFFFSRITVPESLMNDKFEVEVFTENGFTNSNSYKWAKFGLMVRDTMDPKSRHFSVILTPKEGVHAIYRPDFGSDTSRIPGNNDVRGGGWMKLARNGNLFRAYFKKEDTDTYTLLGEKSINMSGSVEVGLALASHASSSCLSETIQFSNFSFQTISDGVATGLIIAQEDREQCLRSNGMNAGKSLALAKCDSSDDLQKFKYYDSSGLLVLNASFPAHDTNDRNVALCANLNSMTVEDCKFPSPDRNQQMVHFNEEFFLSSSHSTKLKFSGVNHWSIAKSLPYLPKAIILQQSRYELSLWCLQDHTSGYPIIQHCDGKSKSQEWEMKSDGRIYSGNGKCISRSTKSKKARGVPIIMASCSRADEWHWRDGSLYLDKDEDYFLEHDGLGHVLLGYAGHERRRNYNQRWLVGNKRYSNYHEDTSSIRIRNEASMPLECALKHLGPVYWGVIMPGEEFYRNTGAVHWTISCNVVEDGVGRIRLGDAIWPPAQFAVNIIVAVFTAGAGSTWLTGATVMKQATAKVAVKAAVAAGMKGLETNNFETFVETFTFTMAMGKVVVPKTSALYTSLTNRMLNTGVVNIVGKGSAAVSATVTKHSPLVKTAVIKGGTQLAKKAMSGSSITISDHGEYANGKMYIVRGGREVTDDEHGELFVQVSALRLERYDDGNKEMLFGSCNSQSDCLGGLECGRRNRGDDAQVCCPDGSGEFGGLDYCLGTVEEDEACWFDDQCEDSGYCAYNYFDLLGPDVCHKPIEAGEECQFDTECRSRYCKGNSNALGTGKCEEKKIAGDSCNGGYDGQCESDACGVIVPNWNHERDLLMPDDDKYVCCPSGDTVTVFTEYCAKSRGDGQSCVKNGHCKSGYCEGSNGMGHKGTCRGPYEVGETCPDGEDDMCFSKSCGLEEAGASRYECCADDTIEHGFLDYCNQLEDGKKCWEDTMCTSGYCAGNGGGVVEGVCATKFSVGLGGNCYNGADNVCVGGLECGLDEAGGKYVCCDDTSVYASLDYCTSLVNGKKCWFDSQCSSGWCEGNCSGTCKGECKGGKKEGESCNTEKNYECHNRSCYRSKRYGDYKCCEETNYCDTYNSGCTTGYWYCANYGDKLG